MVAVGSRSVVRAWGTNAVAKVPNETTPSSWIVHEADYTSAVWALGLPAHRPIQLSVQAGKVVSIYERVHGPTMWALIVAQPHRATYFGVMLAELHAKLLRVTPPVVLPRQEDRLRSKLRRARLRRDGRITDATSELPRPSDVLSLCHGDFHPGNVIMAPDGPVVVDWFDASRGDAAADVARTSLLLGVGAVTSDALVHLPGHTAAMLQGLHAAYLDTALGLLALDLELVERWRRIEAMARLAEDVDIDVAVSPADAAPLAQSTQSNGR